MVRALRKLEVMDAATGTCDCQTLADDGRRRGSLCRQHGSALCGGQKREPESTGTHRVSCASPTTWGQGSAALLWPKQTQRQRCFCVLFWQVGTRGQPCLRKPLYVQPPAHVPGAVSGQSLPAAGLLAQPPGMGGPGAAQGPVKPARVEVLGEWGFSEPGTTLKGRSVTRWSRGRHQSNKCCLHKVTTWVIASLSSLRTKCSGNQEGNSPVGSLSVSLLSRNSWEGEGIPRICPSVQGQ